MTSDVEEHPSIELSGIKRIWNILMLEVWHRRLDRWIPRLVWKGDRIYCRITFKEDRLLLLDGGRIISLDNGNIYKAERLLKEAGIQFDSGQGREGRDWEFDWSLSEEVAVSFVGKRRRGNKND